VDGNPGLAAERGFSHDLGLRWSKSSESGLSSVVSLEAFGFAREVDQLIRFRRTAVESLTPFNVARARVLGLEWALGADLGRHVRLDTAGTLLDPRETTADPRLDPTANDVLPYTSKLTVAAGAEVYARRPLPKLGVDRLALRMSYLHRSSRFADVAGQNVLPSQHLVDLELSSSLFDGGLMTRFAARNLLDSRTSDLIGLPVPGRSYHASAEAWF